MTRRYKSSVRDEQANRTRTALLDACEELLSKGPVEQVTLPKVARRAGVTKPTAYSYFPDNDALLAGFLDHLRDRIGMDHKSLAAIRPAELPAAVRKNYRRFDENAKVVRRVMDSPSYDRVRLSRKVDRAAMALPVWRGVAPEQVLRRNLAPIYMLVTPVSWRWLRDTWGLSADEAASASAWAVQALASALGAQEGKRQHQTKPRRAAKRKEKQS